MAHRTMALFGLLLLLTPWLPAAGVSRPPLAGPPDFDAIDRYVETEMRAAHVPGIALAIVHGDEIVHLQGFGVADDAGRPVTPQTPFIIGSLTKSFTALAVMQLVEAGELELNEPVETYLPWFQVADPVASAKITVRYLLNQTSGLARQACEQIDQMAHGAGAVEANVRALAQVAVSATPGTRFQYCNTNYQVLGLLIEAVSGQSYADYVQTHLFDPLAMAHSYAALAPAQADGLALGHRLMLGLPVPAHDHPYYEGSLPSGYLIASAEDMAHYLIAHLNRGRYQTHEVISALGMLTLHQAPSHVAGDSYAMGWAPGHYAGQLTLQHSGVVPDFISEMWLLPDQDYGVVVLQNAHAALFGNRAAAIGLGVVSQLLGQAPPPVAPDRLGQLALGVVTLMVGWQIVSIAAGRRLIPARRVRSAWWWLALTGAAALDVSVIVVGLYVLPAVAESSLRVMLVYAPDITVVTLLLAAASAVWGLARTLLALRPSA